MADGNGTNGLSLLIQSLIIEQNRDTIRLYHLDLGTGEGTKTDEFSEKVSNVPYSKILLLATYNKLRKSNRQYWKIQQTVLSSPDTPFQTVFKFPKIHAR